MKLIQSKMSLKSYTTSELYSVLYSMYFKLFKSGFGAMAFIITSKRSHFHVPVFNRVSRCEKDSVSWLHLNHTEYRMKTDTIRNTLLSSVAVSAIMTGV
jgi:hypothetical protein